MDIENIYQGYIEMDEEQKFNALQDLIEKGATDTAQQLVDAEYQISDEPERIHEHVPEGIKISVCTKCGALLTEEDEYEVEVCRGCAKISN